MKLTCSNAVIKYLMFGFNLVFVITGIIILAVGVSVKTYYFKYDAFLDDKYFSLPNMLIATGSLIFFISFLGCFGAMRESWLMLMAFSVLLAIIFIFELSVGIAGYTLRDKTSSYLETKLTENMKKYDSSPAISNMWDIIQEEFECCGVSNYTDWFGTFDNYSLPVSCCPRSYGTIGVFYCNAYIPATTTVTPTQDPNNASNNTVITPSVTTPTDGTITTDTSNLTSTNITDTTDISSEPSSTATAKSPSPQKSAQSDGQLKQLTKSQAKRDTTSNNATSTAYPSSSSAPYNTGCEASFGRFLKKHAVDIGAVGLTLAFIQLMGIFLSFHLARQLKNGYYST